MCMYHKYIALAAPLFLFSRKLCCLDTIALSLHTWIHSCHTSITLLSPLLSHFYHTSITLLSHFYLGLCPLVSLCVGSRDLWRFDLMTNEWEQLPLRGGPSARSGHRCVCWLGEGLVPQACLLTLKALQWPALGTELQTKCDCAAML
jgi:hypothetical protein